ncbi:MAG: glycogen/starch synthase [Bacteroidales bacterium]|nr:glycogen/starch synthase [Bacteroidales bacterium]
MARGRILFVSQEITPFTDDTIGAQIGRYLPQYIQEQGRETRVFMPRFSAINDRKHQLHEVIRLSGMNLIVNNCDHQLIIKVGSIPAARMQVYFIDNEEYFTKSGGLFDDNGQFLQSNDERMLFFGRGTLEAVRKLAWQPHLIHFTGWFTSMIPFYLRRINKENAFFSGTKTVFNLGADRFDGRFCDEMERKLKADGATAKDLRMYEGLDYDSLMRAAITYASGVVVTDPNADPELVAFAREKKRHFAEYNEDRTAHFARINKLYDSIIGSNINN